MSDVQIVYIAVSFLIVMTLCIIFVQIHDHFDSVHQLKRSRLRLEVMDGLLFARQHCSEIESIRARPEVEKGLKSAFGLTDRQVEAIMKIKKPLRSISEEGIQGRRQHLLDKIGLLEERTGKRTKLA
jgi:DNA gyrase/topoisomerase IV subunit A